jgi:hypothetical protein
MGAPGSVQQRGAGPLVVSGAALLGWLVGTPLLLLLWGGWPLNGAPGWESFRGLPLPTVVDQVIIGTISMALWGIWGQFAVGVVAEVVAMVRRREPSRRADDAIRRFARHMVESVSQAPSPLARFALPKPPAKAKTKTTRHAEAGLGAAAAPETVISQRLEDILREVEVLVRVLGEVEAVRPAGSAGGSADEQVLPARQKGLEALVYLALSDVGVSRRELERVLFPTGPASERVLYNTVKSVLKVVGDHQPAATTGRHYVLSERVVTDYGLFCDLAAEGERAEDPELGPRCWATRSSWCGASRSRASPGATPGPPPTGPRWWRRWSTWPNASPPCT